jgi:nucleotide-binding universal stress UspA family protein
MIFNQPRISEILFATDLSENANRALEYAVRLAEAFKAHITVLHVVEKVPPNAELLMTAILGYENIDEYRQKSEVELSSRIKTYLEQFCAKIANQMEEECRLVFKKILVEPGNAAERITHHSETGNYDVLMIGSRGLNLLQEKFMGGTSRKVLLNCRIPIFVIPEK